MPLLHYMLPAYEPADRAPFRILAVAEWLGLESLESRVERSNPAGVEPFSHNTKSYFIHYYQNLNPNSI